MYQHRIEVLSYDSLTDDGQSTHADIERIAEAREPDAVHAYFWGFFLCLVIATWAAIIAAAYFLHRAIS